MRQALWGWSHGKENACIHLTVSWTPPKNKPTNSMFISSQLSNNSQQIWVPNCISQAGFKFPMLGVWWPACWSHSAQNIAKVNTYESDLLGSSQAWFKIVLIVQMCCPGIGMHSMVWAFFIAAGSPLWYMRIDFVYFKKPKELKHSTAPTLEK